MPESTELADLTELTTAPASGDWLHVLDVSDTTQDAGGTDKKISPDTLLKAVNLGLTPLTDAGFVAGADCSAAFSALTGGAYFLPPGTYYLDSPATPVLTSSLAIHGVPGQSIIAVRSATGFSNGTSDGDLIKPSTNGSNTAPVDIEFDGVTMHCGLLPNTDPGGAGTLWPVDANAQTQWPPANNKGNGTTTAGAFSAFNMWANSVRFRNCEIYMDDETHVNHHWVDAGGDSALFADLEEIRTVEITGCRFYGSRDSAIYTSQVGTRSQTSRYPSKVHIHGNYFEGCGNGIHIKGESIGGIVHDNLFVNCAQSFGATSGNADVSEQIRFHHNIVDGYWRAVRLQGNNCYVDNNVFFNGGHFAEDGTSMSDLGVTLDDFFDEPYVFDVSAGGGADDPIGNVIAHNDIWGAATSGEHGRTTTWGGQDPVVVFFGTDAQGNRCYDNRIHGVAGRWKRLATSFSTGGDNIITWSDPTMIEDHDMSEWASQAATEYARGPVVDLVLAADFTGLTSDITFQTVTGWAAPIVEDGEYDILVRMPYDASSGGDMKIGFAAPGSSVVTGWWSGDGPGQTGTAVVTVFDAAGSNKAVFTGNGAPSFGQVYGHAIVGTGGAGDLTVQVGQNTSDATATDLLAGARYVVTRTK